MEETESKQTLSDGWKTTLYLMAAFFDAAGLLFTIASVTAFSMIAPGQVVAAAASIIPFIGQAIGAFLAGASMAIGMSGWYLFWFMAKAISVAASPCFMMAFYGANISNFRKKQMMWIITATGFEAVLEFLPFWTILVAYAVHMEKAERTKEEKSYTRNTQGGRREKRREERYSDKDTDENDEFAYAA